MSPCPPRAGRPSSSGPGSRAFATVVDARADRWERRFSTRTDTQGLEVLAPGVPYHRLIFPKLTVWATANVDPALRTDTAVHS